MISETKIDHSFPLTQFLIEGYSQPFRLDRSKHGGGIMLYVRIDIPSKILTKTNDDSSYECFFVELQYFSQKTANNLNRQRGSSNHFHNNVSC